MCQEIHLSDLKQALLDFCEENGQDEEHVQPDDLLAELADLREDAFVHALDHEQRVMQLASVGDDDAALIHRALFANMARAAG